MTLNLLQNLLGSSNCFRARVRLCDNLLSPVRFFRALVALSTYKHIYSSCDRIFKVRFGCVPSRFPFAWVARKPVFGRFFCSVLGSCALAWAVKEVPVSEAGPPDAELPRQTESDPFAQGEARKARARRSPGWQVGHSFGRLHSSQT